MAEANHEEYLELEIKEEEFDEFDAVHHVMTSVEEDDYNSSNQNHDVGYSVELSSYDENAVEEFPSNIDVSSEVGYHIIDGNIEDGDSTVYVCNSIRDVLGIKRKKIQTKKMKFKHQCNICNQRYSTSASLKIHKIRHLSRTELPFKCSYELCNLMFATKIEANRHFSRHNIKFGTKSQSAKRKECDINKSDKNIYNNSINIADRKNLPTSTDPNDSSQQNNVSYITINGGKKQRSNSRKFSNKTVNSVMNILDNRDETLSARNQSATQEDCESSETVIGEQETHLQCGICGFRCDAVDVLKRHLEIRHNQEPKVTAAVACPFCPVTFASSGNLKSHLLSHTNERPFACDECDKSFKMRNRLMAHKKVVHTPKNFYCTFCEKTFSTVHLLNRHERVHTGEKPYSCCFCSFACNAQSNLIKHVRNLHNKPDYTYKQHLIELGNIKSSVPESELVQLQQKGAEVVKRYLARKDSLNLDIDQLKDKVHNDKMEKEIKNSEKRSKKRRFQSAPKIIPDNISTVDSNVIENEMNYDRENMYTETTRSEILSSRKEDTNSVDLNSLTDNLIIVENILLPDEKEKSALENCSKKYRKILPYKDERENVFLPGQSNIILPPSFVMGTESSSYKLNRNIPLKLNESVGARNDLFNVKQSDPTYIISNISTDDLSNTKNIDEEYSLRDIVIDAKFEDECLEDLDEDNQENIVCNPREVQNQISECKKIETEEYSEMEYTGEDSSLCDVIQLGDGTHYGNRHSKELNYQSKNSSKIVNLAYNRCDILEVSYNNDGMDQDDVRIYEVCENEQDHSEDKIANDKLQLICQPQSMDSDDDEMLMYFNKM